MIQQRAMRPSVPRVNERLQSPGVAANRHSTAPVSHTGPSPRKLLLIFRPLRVGSWVDRNHVAERRLFNRHERWVAFGSVGNVVSRINEVDQRRARLVLGWMTVDRRVNHFGM